MEKQKKHRTIYLSGKISGEDKQKCWEKFAKAEDDMRAKGFKVINPLKIREPECKVWERFMLRDLSVLSRKCDCLYAMADWQDSIGASIEVAFAIGTGRIDILYEI